jgi:glycosyltransferase involved in cell wall biosynthesis
MHDVCLLLEGSYPFISGGVSTWVHNLVRGAPDLDFCAQCILPSSKQEWPYRYELPKNLTEIRTIYLHDPEDVRRSWFGLKKKDITQLREWHAQAAQRDYSDIKQTMEMIRSPRATLKELVYGRKAWRLMLEFYWRKSSKESFLDYFWTQRLMHLPVYKVLRADVPKARVYHAISTGYAGLLGVAARLLYGRPLLLTEHGIYVKERKIEISQAEWIYTAGEKRVRIERNLGRFQDMWTQMFEHVGRLTYRHASRIYTLYEGNRQIEISEGADPGKVEIIPNGIDIERFQDLVSLQEAPKRLENPKIGFVGRVVSIKDVKTFIRALKIVSMQLDAFQAYIMGPTEEDEEYYKECLELTRLLRLENNVEFTGKVKVEDYYPSLDLIVLTSISEAQPLVVMEANCAGIPAVCSDVGSCRELLEGRTPEDMALGASGVVTPVADPSATAEAILRIVTHPKLWQSMSIAGRERIKTFYREDDLNRRYQDIYARHMALPDLDASTEEAQGA